MYASAPPEISRAVMTAQSRPIPSAEIESFRVPATYPSPEYAMGLVRVFLLHRQVDGERRGECQLARRVVG